MSKSLPHTLTPTRRLYCLVTTLEDRQFHLLRYDPMTPKQANRLRVVDLHIEKLQCELLRRLDAYDALAAQAEQEAAQ